MFKRVPLSGLLLAALLTMARVSAAPLAGQNNDLHTLLAAESIELPDGAQRALTPELSQFIAAHQPAAGDDLLKLIADAKHPLRRYAINAFRESWATMSGAQINAYIGHLMQLKVAHRPTYPRDGGASIALSYEMAFGWGGFPDNKEIELHTRTTHFLDGQPLGQPYEGRGPWSTTGWIETKNLKLGPHTASLQMDYEFERDGAQYRGHLDSPLSRFEITDDQAGDTLLAPESAESDAALHEALIVLEKEEVEPFPIITGTRALLGPPPPPDPWAPQITWTDGVGNKNGIHAPLWKLTKPLPFDLCFTVQIEDIQSGEIFAGDAIIIPSGQAHNGYFAPRDVQQFAGNRTGSVAVNISLIPSRAMALTDLQIAHYYAKPILFAGLNIDISG